MCGRYYIDQEDDLAEMRQILQEISRRFQDQAILNQLRTGEIFPTHLVPVLRAEKATEGKVKIVPDLMRWGFSRPGGSGVILNARAETAAEKPMFRQPFRYQRILVPASAFFEWKATGPGEKKQKVRLDLPEQSTFYMAGFSRQETADDPPRFVILTTRSGADVAVIHDRQPLIVPRSWLRSWIMNLQQAGQLLSQPDEPHIRLTDVS